MNRGPLLFLATFILMGASLLTFVVLPQSQIGSQQQVEEKQNGQLYPLMRAGMARQGEQIYRANGCFYCHTEQVRPKGFGSDVARGWGARPGDVQNVAQDYLYDHPAMPDASASGPTSRTSARGRRTKKRCCSTFTARRSPRRTP